MTPEYIAEAYRDLPMWERERFLNDVLCDDFALVSDDLFENEFNERHPIPVYKPQKKQ